MRKFTLILSFSILFSLLLTGSALASGTIKHIVKANDTLSGIAASYQVTVQSIVNLNKLSNPNKLQIGQTLLIPSVEKNQPGNKPATANVTENNTVQNEKYTVQARDTLTGIARAKGVSVADLIAANKIANPNALQIGQVLIIPRAKQNQPLASREDNRERENGEETASEENVSHDTVQELIAYAKEYLGRPYAYSATGPDSFDCSGFTRFVFGHFGIELPHSSAAQAEEGDRVKRKDLIPGDLVFFRTSKKGISHVGIYIGKDKFIHASTGAREVEISSLSEAYYDQRYVTACRVI